MRHNEFTDDLVFRPSLPAILISVALWSAIGFIIASLFAGAP